MSDIMAHTLADDNYRGIKESRVLLADALLEINHAQVTDGVGGFSPNRGPIWAPSGSWS